MVTEQTNKPKKDEDFADYKLSINDPGKKYNRKLKDVAYLLKVETMTDAFQSCVNFTLNNIKQAKKAKP